MNILAKQVKCYQCNEKIDDEKFITGRVLKEDKNGKERSYKKNFHDKCAVEFGMQFINKPTETQVKNCHHCGGIVEEIDLIIRPIPQATKHGVELVKRPFHQACLPKYKSIMEYESDTKEENSQWDECYKYFKDLLGIKDGHNLDSFATMRILGLRVGKYTPKGDNLRGIKRGYDFETILMTMKFCSLNIRTAFSTMSFKDQSHKVNYAMKLITDNVNFVAEKLERRRVADRKLDVIIKDIQPHREAEYKTQGSTGISKVGEIISSIVDEGTDQEMQDIMNLF